MKPPCIVRTSPHPQIWTAAGRHFYGRWPVEITSDRGEAPFIRRLAEQVDGLAEVRLPVGRADVATGASVFEVEPAKQWQVGARQAYGYAGMSGLAPAVALFGSANYRSIRREIEHRTPDLSLWVWGDGQWWPQDANSEAARLWLARNERRPKWLVEFDALMDEWLDAQPPLMAAELDEIVNPRTRVRAVAA